MAYDAKVRPRDSGYLFVAPFLVVFLAMLVLPLGYAAYLSLFQGAAHRRHRLRRAGQLHPRLR